MRDYNTQAVAAHEAGHACVALALGVEIKLASIEVFSSEPTILGRVLYRYPFGKYTGRQIAVFTLGGPEAERQFRKESRLRPYAEVEGIRDLLWATRAPNDPPVETLVEECETLATALVLVHEKWIAAVARRLLKHNLLYADDVLDLRP